MTKRKNLLALCLLDAIENLDFDNLQSLLSISNADPSFISDRNIAAFHYIVGIEDSEFAYRGTKLFLEYKADPNVKSEENLTPVHIACLYGRADILKLLLEHGGSVEALDAEGKTPILYAIYEEHYQVIEVIKKFQFEKKLEKKRRELCPMKLAILNSKKLNDSLVCVTPTPNNQALRDLEENKFTPNRINYNFDATSPYFVNITHRKFGRSKSANSSVNPDETPSENLNIFDLTERNLHEFSKNSQTVIVQNELAISKRRSYISEWRKKIQQIRKPDNKLDINYINYLNSCNDVTFLNDGDPNEARFIVDMSYEESNDSFITAQSDFKNLQIEVKVEDEVLEKITEDYVHTDYEKGIVFCEKKIVLGSQKQTDDDDNSSQSSLATKITLPSMDYDSDVLRAELTRFGGAPGPITKSTKQLYLKQLVKFKRDPERTLAHSAHNMHPVFSVELQRTMNNFNSLHENLSEFLQLEVAMSECFQQKNNVRWREGHLKTSFIYLLIDPRLAQNLPLIHKNMPESEVWSKFLRSIFYVGKGKKGRPYEHLYDAIKLYSAENDLLAEKLQNRQNRVLEKRILFSDSDRKKEVMQKFGKTCDTQPSQSKIKESEKLNKIIDIWKDSSKLGVCCLQIYHNIIPAEAYTREASIIDAIGLNNLTNLKRGDYYGVTSGWKMRQRKHLGVALLYKAMQIYLAEGESQLMPFDLV